VLNAANEEAVAAFLAERIGFLDIERVVEKTLDRAETGPVGSLDDVYRTDAEARRVAAQLM
jgi:1-deoxy-D-xylulose-5-phosphate reductoisomerase